MLSKGPMALLLAIEIDLVLPQFPTPLGQGLCLT